jgi:integrase
MTDEYPHAAPWKDQHGRTRWRYRRGKKTVYLPQEPGHPDFESAYQAAIAGLPAPAPRATAEVVAHPSAAKPESLRAAWRIYTTNFPDWKAMHPTTRSIQTKIAEKFLLERIAEDIPDIWGDMPVADLRRRHIRMILANMSDRPHAARRRLDAIRKMILAAIEEEWIDADPAYKLRYRPAVTAGFRAWTDHEITTYERHWSIGTTPRLIYELVLWLGPRRSDVARLKPENIHGNKIQWKTSKTGRVVTMPITPRLRAALDVADLSGPTIVKTAYGEPFSIKSLTGRMRDWVKLAGLDGCTLHGLRKTLGKRIAEAGGSTRQAMAALGHDDIQQAELYSEEANREKMAEEAMEKVVKMVESKRRPKPG